MIDTAWDTLNYTGGMPALPDNYNAEEIPAYGSWFSAPDGSLINDSMGAAIGQDWGGEGIWGQFNPNNQTLTLNRQREGQGKYDWERANYSLADNQLTRQDQWTPYVTQSSGNWFNKSGGLGGLAAVLSAGALHGGMFGKLGTAGAAGDVAAKEAAYASMADAAGGLIPAQTSIWSSPWVQGAALGGGSSAIQGGNLGDIFKGALLGGVSGGVGSMNTAGMLGVDNPFMKGIINKGVGGAVASGVGGGDVGKGFLAGGASGGLNAGNLGATMGIQDSGLQNIFNRAASGGISSGIYGGNPLAGAVTAAAPSAINYGISQASQPDEPQYSSGPAYTSPVQSALDNMTQQSRVPELGQSPLIPEFEKPASTQGTDFYPSFESSGGSNAFQQFMGSLGLDNGIPNPFGGANVPIGDFAGGLMGLYSAINQRNRAKSFSRGLANMYGPNSPYAQQLEKRLLTKDAAAGRRSQYGPREVELQARLAEIASRNTPYMNAAMNAETQGNNATFRSILGLGKLFGLGGGTK
jgi:hypothetical protein